MYVVGHRGAAGVVPENTLKGFDYAIKLGVDYVEVEQAFQRGLDIRAWNPDSLGEQQAMIALGVSGICTNRPDMLIEHLRQEGLKS